MDHPPPISHESVLCERCGYSLARLEESAACPECGTPVALSLPQRRTGSAWQRRPGVSSWGRTLAGLIVAPRRFWVQVQVERRRSGALLLVNLLLASLGATTVLLPGPAFQVPPVPYLIAFFIVSWLLAAAMTSVEFTGIRLLGGRRGYRITARSALTIVSHASYGWIIAGVGMGIAGNVARRFDWLWDGTASTVTGFPDIVVYGLIVAVPVLVGMSVFSGWAGVGAFSMRYANESARPGIGSPRVTSAAEGR